MSGSKEKTKIVRKGGLESLLVYQKSMVLGRKTWDIVAAWDYFLKDTIGKQWVRSTDSIAANISEGYGRYHYKEAKQFYYYSRGSLFETGTWATKAYERKLISKTAYDEFMIEINQIGKMLNAFISATGKKGGTTPQLVNEPLVGYGPDLEETPNPIINGPNTKQ